MDFMKLHLYVTLAAVAVAAWVVVTGYVPHDIKVDNAVVTVRQNPSTYVPIYAAYTGYHALKSSGSSRTGSSGGYRSGK